MNTSDVVIVVHRDDFSQSALYVDGKLKTVVDGGATEVLEALSVPHVIVKLNERSLSQETDFPYIFDQDSVKDIVALFLKKNDIGPDGVDINRLTQQVGPRFWYHSNCEYYILAVKPEHLGTMTSAISVPIHDWISVSEDKYDWDVEPKKRTYENEKAA